jgi:hypothetical protein
VDARGGLNAAECIQLAHNEEVLSFPCMSLKLISGRISTKPGTGDIHLIRSVRSDLKSYTN